jgi:hypothetical protein
MNRSDPLWIAQRHDQDWRDEDILRTIAWLTSNIDAGDWARRIETVRTKFEAARVEWAAGRTVALFDPDDLIAWYVFQANAYAADRADWFEPEAFRIAPVFRRLGQILDRLRQVDGADERAARLMTEGRKQPDDGLFEFLVAGAYKGGGWHKVAFVKEKPGVAKTQDLLVSTSGRRWAVECKRVNRSGYEAAERATGDVLAAPVHERCAARGRSVVMEVAFRSELADASADYLLDRLDAFLADRRRSQWDDPVAQGRVRDVDWRLARTVLAHDDVFFGSSRMVQLLAGQYRADADHSVAANWTPAEGRPLYATAVRQASVVSWMSLSPDAARRKAKHFRGMVGQATGQLPGDCPAVVHVGYEARDGNSVDGLRHMLNRREMDTFDPSASRLRWVYGNYLSPEHTNDRNESSALSETMATYRIGRHRTPDPLPRHMLFDDAPGLPGAHFVR